MGRVHQREGYHCHSSTDVALLGGQQRRSVADAEWLVEECHPRYNSRREPGQNVNFEMKAC